MFIKIWHWIKGLFTGWRKSQPEKLPQNVVIPKPKIRHIFTPRSGTQHCKRCHHDNVRLYHWKGFDFCYQCCTDLRSKK